VVRTTGLDAEKRNEPRRGDGMNVRYCVQPLPGWQSSLGIVLFGRRIEIRQRIVGALRPLPPLKQDDIEYAIENTQVILAPERQIATFGNTSFEFHLISELMDRVDQVRIRTGRIEAERPKILSPEYFCRMMLEGFGDKAQEYVDRLREQARQIAVLRYGFQFRKSGVTEETVNASLQSVIDRTRRAVENAGDTNGAIIQGVDEAWEVCLLKFTIEMIERSAGENIGDFKRRGLI
jgi:hypothetical protein